MTEDEMIRYHHQLNGHEFEQTPGDSGEQMSLASVVHEVTKSQTLLSDFTFFYCLGNYHCLLYGMKERLKDITKTAEEKSKEIKTLENMKK